MTVCLGLTGGIALLFVGLDGDDYFFLTRVRGLPRGEFFDLFWPVTGITFRILRYVPPWILSHLFEDPVLAIRVVASLAFVPTIMAVYGVSRRLLPGAGGVLLTALAILSFFPFPWAYGIDHWSTLGLFAPLWLWLRWWDDRRGSLLAASMLANAVGLLNYEMNLVLPVVCYAAGALRLPKPAAALPAFRERLGGCIAITVPVLVYGAVRFGVLGNYHYYGGATLELGGGPWGRLSDFPLAVAGTLGSAWRASLALGTSGKFAGVLAGLILGLVGAGAIARREEVRKRLFHFGAAALIAVALLLPQTSVFKDSTAQVFAAWGLGLAVLTLLAVPPTRWVVPVGLACIAVSGWSAANRTVRIAARAAFHRTVARELRRQVDPAQGACDIFLRDLPRFVHGMPTATTADSFGRAALPRVLARESRVYAWWADQPVSVLIYESRGLHEPTGMPDRPERLFLWRDGGLQPDPMVRLVLPLAERPLAWGTAADGDLRRWIPSVNLARTAEAQWRATGSAPYELRSPRLSQQHKRHRWMHIRFRLQGARKAGATLMILGEFASAVPTPLTSDLHVGAVVDGQWREYWIPLHANPHLNMFAPLQRFILRLDAPRDTLLEIERIVLVP